MGRAQGLSDCRADLPVDFPDRRSMTIRQEIFSGIRGPIAGHEQRATASALPPMAISGPGSSTARIPGQAGLTTSGHTSSPASSSTLSPTWARTAADALGVIGLPAAVLSGACRLAAANKLFERLIPQVVQDRPPRLCLADRRADALLGRLLAGACDGTSAIPLAATRALPASIAHVFPAQDADDAGAASLLLVIATIARPQIVSARILQDLFDLTPAEARVARGIAAGKTTRDLAAEAGLAVGTVRQQLKSVFGKTGVSRQADLVGLLLGGMLSFPGGGLA
jgi:DNA-binding CsgD family transcriptional regulator